ncbi:MAG TPA: amidase family protein [Streptosporangiaceae bacterium]|nr:amidase family protein [Streptosporangiaceae bacterium]
MSFAAKQGRGERAPEMSESLKLAALLGRDANDRYDGRHYAMAGNLALELTSAYDAALADIDVLIVPTLPIMASVIPAADASGEEKLARSLEMITNTAPFDVSGHPATSVPVGLSDGLPVGLMIVDCHFADGTCLRVARADRTWGVLRGQQALITVRSGTGGGLVMLTVRSWSHGGSWNLPARAHVPGAFQCRRGRTTAGHAVIFTGDVWAVRDRVPGDVPEGPENGRPEAPVDAERNPS